jgi:hypothetical protein
MELLKLRAVAQWGGLSAHMGDTVQRGAGTGQFPSKELSIFITPLPHILS